MPRKIPRLKAPVIIKLLQRHNFTLISQRGSHQKWRNEETGKQVIIPFHSGKELPLGTMRSIIDGSDIPEKEFNK